MNPVVLSEIVTWADVAWMALIVGWAAVVLWSADR